MQLKQRLIESFKQSIETQNEKLNRLTSYIINDREELAKLYKEQETYLHLIEEGNKLAEMYNNKDITERISWLVTPAFYKDDNPKVKIEEICKSIEECNKESLECVERKKQYEEALRLLEG